TWRPDGGTLTSFDSLDPNGTWTIFFADMSSGAQSTLISWGLEVQPVPEPVTWALIIFGGLAMIFHVVRYAMGPSKRVGLSKEKAPGESTGFRSENRPVA